MRTRLRRRHRIARARLYTGGGILQRRILKWETRKIMRSMNRILIQESLND